MIQAIDFPCNTTPLPKLANEANFPARIRDGLSGTANGYPFDII